MEDIKCSFCQKDRGKVKQIIAGPIVNNTTIYICNECVDLSYAVVHEQPKIYEIESDDEVYTPSQIKSYLDNFIIGQEEAKVTISVAIYNHYKRILDVSDDDIELEKSNLLMIGPSGSGKTLIVKTIAQLFDLPYVIADATSLTEAGYVGEDVENMLDLLLAKANGDIEKAQRGIVFIDEIDKIGRKGESSTVNRDVSGEGVQQSLLKLIEGTVAQVADPSNRMGDPIEFDTTNILFIASGAFVDLPNIIKSAKKTSSIGIGAKMKTEEEDKYLLSDVQPEHLVKYGLIPEFVGRLPVIVTLDELTEDILFRILTEPKNNLVLQYAKLFKKDGVDLVFDDNYIHKVARESLQRKTGARGLRSIIEKTLLTTQFNLPDLAKKGLEKVLIDKMGDTKYFYKKKPRKKVNKDEKA